LLATIFRDAHTHCGPCAFLSFHGIPLNEWL
jgi:hypothetical protein